MPTPCANTSCVISPRVYCGQPIRSALSKACDWDSLMCGPGVQELLIILLIAVFVFRGEKLPEIA